VSIIVPKGVRGTIGVGIGYGGQVVIPNTSAELIYTDDEVLTWPVDGLPVGVQWQLATDPQAWFDHMITVRMSVDEIPPRIATGVLPEPVEPAALAPLATDVEDVPAPINDTLDVGTEPIDTTSEV
jgi:hypothetical protein